MPDVDDLWGADFHPNNAESKPVTLLKKQAELLGKKTRGQVQSVVKQNVAPDGNVLGPGHISTIHPILYPEYSPRSLNF